MSRSTSTASSVTTTNGQAVARSLSLKTNTNTKPHVVNPLPTPDIKLFVTNLRLLDLDLRSDWPDVTIQTFSAKNADQKQRIGGTEWALFRLFEIWDPSETAQKLQPFFPPLEPLQSLNLRAALYRCLNELKKSGVLGRDSVLRKTMLDECKGEKFYEVLAVFSTVVLKKVLAAQEGSRRNAAVARTLAMASVLPAEKQQSLLPLAIAHKAALTNVLKRKEEKRRRYLEFEQLLDTKAEDINRRIRKCKETPRAKRPAVPQKEADALKKQLKDNWIGNQQWLDVMLHGDDVQAEDAFLNSRFDKVWRMVEAGRKMGDAATETGLLEHLQSRVDEQQERLQKWKAFSEELQKDVPASKDKVAKAAATVKQFNFDDHLRYKLPTSKQKFEEASIRRPTLRAEYQDILSTMDADLEQVSKNRPAQTFGSLSRRRRSSASATRPSLRTRNTSRSESIPKVPTSPVRTAKPPPQIRKQSLEQIPLLPRPRHTAPTDTPLDSEATLVGHASTLRRSSIEHQTDYRREPEPTPPTSDPVVEASSPPHSHKEPIQAPQRSPSPTPSPEASYYPSEPPIPVIEYPELNPEDALAEQIISSIGAATPSPVKKPQPRMSLSLVERTRMSMARTTSFAPVPESPDPLPSMPPPPPPPVEEEIDRRATLLERTRQSMVAMQSKPRKSMSAREKKEKRQSRQSLFPVNQFDTPRNRKSIELIEQARSAQLTPKEELLEEEDYERVFKSRPRIATSPVFEQSMMLGDDEEFSDDEDVEVTGIDLGDVDGDEDEEEGAWADSPSRRRGMGVVGRY